ncbi:hypothetical protein B0H17DRAFT_1190419 [Mycena rosella]|uniref:Uncharacterized protein n=1 Tax=Mycena rosella TaxID=1033263 RepID=A0AAD7H3P5_MYCRO|nr:hypothetical protein B0H17DRAFT_1190419 [Mycena rosella]
MAKGQTTSSNIPPHLPLNNHDDPAPGSRINRRSENNTTRANTCLQANNACPDLTGEEPSHTHKGITPILLTMAKTTINTTPLTTGRATSTPVHPTSIALDVQPETPTGAHATTVAARTVPTAGGCAAIATTANSADAATPSRAAPAAANATAAPSAAPVTAAIDFAGPKPTNDADVSRRSATAPSSPGAGTTFTEAPHTDISEYSYGTTDLSLPEDVDARARDNVRSPEPSSPPPDILVRMVVQATEKITDKFRPTDTVGAQAATDITEGFRAKSSDATALPVDPDEGPLADNSAANDSVVEIVRHEFRNLATEYLTQDNVKGLVELAVHKCAQKGKGRAEPAVPFPQAGRPVFFSPIAHEMEEGERLFHSTVARLDPHLDADTERAIAENELANRALPEFDPVQVARAKAHSLGLDPGPVSQDTSTPQLLGEPLRAAARRPDGPSGVSPSPPKKA